MEHLLFMIVVVMLTMKEFSCIDNLQETLDNFRKEIHDMYQARMDISDEPFNVLKETTGEISSPGYPHSYPNQFVVINWEIEVKPGHLVVVDFVDMNLPGSYRTHICGDVFLMYGYTNQLQQKVVKDTVCGVPNLKPFVSGAGPLWLMFINGYSRTQRNNTGFKIKYHTRLSEQFRNQLFLVGVGIVIITVVCIIPGIYYYRKYKRRSDMRKGVYDMPKFNKNIRNGPFTHKLSSSRLKFYKEIEIKEQKRLRDSNASRMSRAESFTSANDHTYQDELSSRYATPYTSRKGQWSIIKKYPSTGVAAARVRSASTTRRRTKPSILRSKSRVISVRTHMSAKRRQTPHSKVFHSVSSRSAYHSKPTFFSASTPQMFEQNGDAVATDVPNSYRNVRLDTLIEPRLARRLQSVDFFSVRNSEEEESLLLASNCKCKSECEKNPQTQQSPDEIIHPEDEYDEVFESDPLSAINPEMARKDPQYLNLPSINLTESNISTSSGAYLSCLQDPNTSILKDLSKVPDPTLQRGEFRFPNLHENSVVKEDSKINMTSVSQIDANEDSKMDFSALSVQESLLHRTWTSLPDSLPDKSLHDDTVLDSSNHTRVSTLPPSKRKRPNKFLVSVPNLRSLIMTKKSSEHEVNNNDFSIHNIDLNNSKKQKINCSYVSLDIDWTYECKGLSMNSTSGTIDNSNDETRE